VNPHRNRPPPAEPPAQADVALRVGPAEPVEIEEMLAGIARPTTRPTDYAIDPEC
jgi:hypothetical protein